MVKTKGLGRALCRVGARGLGRGRDRDDTDSAEDDILCLAKLILPALNFAISRMRALFSGEPSMTLKVII